MRSGSSAAGGSDWRVVRNIPMALSTGTRLGVYEVTAQIGEGGMGQGSLSISG